MTSKTRTSPSEVRDTIKGLEAWRRYRRLRGLDTRLLDWAIVYLDEYQAELVGRKAA